MRAPNSPLETGLEFVAIIGLSVVASIVYGIAHDLVTAHVSVEYFTIGHPPVFATGNPVELAIGWGVIATWWVGASLGILLALAAQAGTRPRRTARSLIRPIARLMAITAASALAAGLAGYWAATTLPLTLQGPLGEAIPPDRHARFLADACAHSASYGIGALGGIVLAILIWRSRQELVA
jgi:hypothetical protein